MKDTETVVVIGGAGLIGSAIARHLAGKGKYVVIADIRMPLNQEVVCAEYVQLDVLQQGAVAQLMDDYQPVLVVNAVNSATLFSRHVQSGYDKIIQFYVDLYRSLRALPGSIHYVQIGTTGSGGLGFNIPFTHGDKLEDLPIINKAAFAGIATSMLTLLSRSFPSEKVRISELKPGLAIFADIIFESMVGKARLVTLDGGESGHYTYHETALLTQFMGFTTVSRIVAKVEALLDLHKGTVGAVAHDIIASINSTILTQEERDNLLRDKYLKKMQILQKNDPSIITTGNLGPPPVVRDLVVGYVLSQEPNLSKQAFSHYLATNTSVLETLSYIAKKNEQLAKYLHEECTYEKYELLQHYYRSGFVAWQIAGAALSKQVPV